jgi:hypothetical protein
VISVLELIGPDRLARLEVLDLRESAKLSDAAQLRSLAPALKATRLELGDAPKLAKKLAGVIAHVGTEVTPLSIHQ